MKRLKAFMASSSRTTKVLFIAAVALLVIGGIGSAWAALTAFSEDRVYEVELHHIGIGLLENGVRVDESNVLLENMLGADEDLHLGAAYPEAIAVSNRGNIDMYVRVSLYKYWLNADGEKDPTLSPDLIGLHLTPGDNWLIDEKASTPERTVLYYKKILPVDEVTDPLSDVLVIDPSLAEAYTETTTEDDEYTVITRTYDYDGYKFMIEARTDGVQTHNAEDAIWSAWGVRMKAEDGVLSWKEAE